MKKNSFVSLIIVNYNHYDLTKACIESILGNTSGVKYEIIVVDNGSTDQSIKRLKKKFSSCPFFRLVCRKTNDFLVPAYNDGFKVAKGQFIVFMNNDLTFKNGWLKELLWGLSQKRAGIVSPAILSYSKKEIVDNLGGKINLLGFGKNTGRGRKYSGKKRASEVFFAPGAILGIRSSLFKKLRGFDNSYQINYEDVDLSWRARLQDYRIFVAEKSIVYHLGSSPTIQKYIGNVNSAFLCRKNRLMTLIKNAGKIYLTLILPMSFLAHGMLFLKEIVFDRNIQLATQTPKAFAWVWKNRHEILKKRKLIQSSRIVSDWKVLKHTSLF